MKHLEENIRATLKEQIGLSNSWKDGTYLYHLTRAKSAFEVGTMTLEDFVEVDEEFLEELVEAVIKTVYKYSKPKLKENKFKNMTE